MIAGADYMEFHHDKNLVTVTIRQNGTTAMATLTVAKAQDAVHELQRQITSASNWLPPSLIEYTSELDALSEQASTT